jgi:uroporphyrinogen-III synthase
MNSALVGKRVLVTRPKNRGGKLVEMLQSKGAIPILLPATEIAEPIDVQLLDRALIRLNEFDWIVFTSVNGVEAVKRRLEVLNVRFQDFPDLRVAVVGPSTGKAVEEIWKTPDAMPNEFISDEIADLIPNLPGTRILLPRGDLARPELSESLASMGATLLDVIAYRILSRTGRWEYSEEDVPDVITFLSGESARVTINQLKECGLEEWLENVPVACIGPVTAASVREDGILPAAVAEEHTISGLLKALEEMFEREAFVA